MSERYPNQSRETRLRRESSYGVAGSGDFLRLNGLSMMISPSITTNPVRVPGLLVQSGVTVDDSFGVASISGRLDFNALLFILAGAFGQPTLTDLGGSPNAYQWDWVWKGRKPNRPVSFEAFSGFAKRAEKAMGYISNSLSISGARPDGFDVSGDGFAKTPVTGQTMGGVVFERQTLSKTGTVSGGTFTITFNGEETADIAYNATAADIKTALEAIYGIESGDIVTAGGPAHTTNVTIDFQGYYAGEDVSLMTVDSTNLVGGGSYGIAETTPGDDVVYDVPQVVAGAITGDVYIDTSWAGLGTSHLLDCLGMSLDIGERMSRVTPINSSFSSDGVIDVAEQDHTMGLTLASNAVLDAEIAKLVAGTPSFVRQKWTGPTISGGNKFLLQVDACVVYSDIGESENTQEVDTRELTGAISLDPTSGNVLAIRLINRMPTLSPTAS